MVAPVPIHPITDTTALRARTDRARQDGQRVGFVPTMGALHEGHLALVAHAAERAELVVVSIFVNPTQFGPGEDFERYPRTLDADLARLAQVGAPVVVFTPSARDMYPPGDDTRVSVGAMSQVLCGPHRPGHFEGVATVVSKFFNLVGPCVAVFGKKDYQQLQIVRRMALDLLMPIEVIGHPTLREADGLAKSSRNRFLAPADRQRALAISTGLAAVHAAFSAGERRLAVLTAALRAPLSQLDSLDYALLSDADSLQPLDERVGERVVAAVAGRLGSTRLIDNVVLGEDPSPHVSSR